MNSNSEHPLQALLIGLGAIIVSLFMTSGEWDIFDFGIAIALLGFGWAFLRIKNITFNNKWTIVLGAGIFGIVTTAALIALISMVAALVPNDCIAKVDIETYELVFPNKKIDRDQLYRCQIYWQSGLFLVSLIAWGSVFIFTNRNRAKRMSALFVALQTLKSDKVFQAGNRGARKLLVTELYPTKEENISEVMWKPLLASGKCPVQAMKDAEIAVFNQNAKQDRHYHKRGTEVYMVLEGKMKIEVEKDEFTLSSGDMIVVNPKARHEVKPEDGQAFMCRVVTLNCGGESDKYLA